MHNRHIAAGGISDAMDRTIGTDAEETVITSGFVVIRTPSKNRVCFLYHRIGRTAAEQQGLVANMG